MSNDKVEQKIEQAQVNLEDALKALKEEHTTQLSAKDSAYLKLKTEYDKAQRALKKKEKPIKELIQKEVNKTYDRVNAAADRLIDYQVAQTQKWQDKYDTLKAEMKEGKKIQDGLLTTLDNLIIEKDWEAAINENELRDLRNKTADYDQMKENYKKMQNQLELADMQLENRYNLNSIKNEQRSGKI